MTVELSRAARAIADTLALSGFAHVDDLTDIAQQIESAVRPIMNDDALSVAAIWFRSSCKQRPCVPCDGIAEIIRTGG